jgi:hypothetical protein
MDYPQILSELRYQRDQIPGVILAVEPPERVLDARQIIPVLPQSHTTASSEPAMSAS